MNLCQNQHKERDKQNLCHMQKIENSIPNLRESYSQVA